MGRRSGGSPDGLHIQRISIRESAILANQDPLKTERKLGPYSLPPNDPDYPIDYILDGQQRATSIFGVFQSALRSDAGEDESIFKIYFDLTQDSTVQDSNFIYVPDN